MKNNSILTVQYAPKHHCKITGSDGRANMDAGHACNDWHIYLTEV